jgi:hypothetical protein
MPTGGELVSLVQEWLSGEKALKKAQANIRLLRKNQKEASDNLLSFMKSNEIDCLDVNDGRLSHVTSKSRSGVSKAHLLASIGSFFEDDDAREMSERLTGHILASRKTTVKDKLTLRKPRSK